MFIQDGRGADFESMKARWFSSHPRKDFRNDKIRDLEKENQKLKDELKKMKEGK